MNKQEPAISTVTSGHRRLHPLSLVFELAAIVRSNILPSIAAIFGTSQGGWIGFGVGSIIIAICLAVAIIRYLTFRYTISNNELIVDQGLVHRLHRVVPLNRIQNIDLSQNFFHRLVGVGEVRVETASGKEPEAIMRVLALSEFALLKAELLASNDRYQEASGQTTAIDPMARSLTQAKVEDCQLILALPLRLVLLAGFLSNRGEVIAGITLGFLWELRFGHRWFTTDSVRGIEIGEKSDTAKSIASDGSNIKEMIDSVLENYSVAGSLVLLLFCLLVLFAILRAFSAAWYLFRFYGYRLEAHGESLQVRCGLLTKVTATIPRGRVQLISVQRSWLQRKFGLASIRIETAGGGVGKSDNAAASVGRKWFVPVIPMDSIGIVLAAIDHRAQYDERAIPWQALSKDTLARMLRPVFLWMILAILTGLYWRPSWGWIPGVLFGVAGTFYIRKKSKSKRYSRTEWGLIFRSGTWAQKCSMTFFDKIQNVSYSQSPFDRRWKMANLSIDTAASGPADHRIQISYLDSEFAGHEFQEIRVAMNEDSIKVQRSDFPALHDFTIHDFVLNWTQRMEFDRVNYTTGSSS